MNDSFAAEPKELYDPQKYILSLGGKRIRPLLALVGCDLFDADPSEALHAAMSVELFHNFSLMHDDIMDQAPLRRGSTTVHEKWNTNIAILSGDAMLVKAYQYLANSGNAKLPELLKLFNRTAIEVCEGQQLDMNFESRTDVTIAEYLHMITLKTAVLLGCSLHMGAIAANASPDDQQRLYTFGKEIGIAFQLKDDILDVYAGNEKFGKQRGGDIISNKKTFLLLKCRELANAEQKAEVNSWLERKDFGKTEKVQAIKKIYEQLNIQTISEAEVQKHYTAALKNLEPVSCDPQKKKDLLLFAENLMNREY
ncbi:MAG: geranylgeranyl pyrophosphate synthase [Bacteroidetes bacterium]|jgi:geranylgeranyl diphosphate synthase type II|nr:geranylgeranyl pyrophosphate synthase [Bacteroidota bacterium]